ncbi:prolipoprotein diacylglyceryl transferase [Deltaproteobacteria bacterium]|nr:prolipoprotein diacylglyceryl transferase [Deltaproteobacteria bacterium]
MWKTLYQQPGGDLAINTWGVMVTLAFAAAAFVVHHRTKKVGINPDWMVWLYVIAIVAGLAGARLLHFTMATPKEFFADPMIFFRIWQGGFALLGGVILAGIGGCIYAVARGINVWKMCDAVMPAVLLGVSIGRMGCFFAGCCHGSLHALPDNAIALFPDSFASGTNGGQLWLVPGPPFLLEMTNNGVGKNHVIVMATQLYETMVTLGIFLSMSWLWRRRMFDGQVFGTTLMLYGIWRPFNETLRGDDVRGTDWFGHFTTSQVMSVPVFLLGLIILLVKFRSGVKPETPFEPSQDELVSGSAPKF